MSKQQAYSRDGISSIDELVVVIIDKRLTFAVKLPHLWVGQHVKVAICYITARQLACKQVILFLQQCCERCRSNKLAVICLRVECR